ncbi:hypothetical protein HZZ00_11150 [Streptomyces sp. NEAU-sy36]|uniref:hypothetical protein n=1 Tax=unclassified Streptomyces TaxID=2593676 RepID=UPI0015D583B1|nr:MULTISPECIES: hypothetical protein [unclassified Streptomyces]QLJ01528.1 hypothetical protein HZZ00_11150 [Streptomyces sp. NEAU-sy36]
MTDYSNPNTRLTAPAYAWSVTLTRGPLKNGINPSRDCTGSYAAQPGDTVGTLLDGIKTWYSRQYNVPLQDVVLVRYSLREK